MSDVSMEKQQSLLSRVFWFGVGGGMSVAINWSIYYLFEGRLGWAKAQAFAVSLGVVTTVFAIWNYRVNFRTDHGFRECLARYLVAIAFLIFAVLAFTAGIKMVTKGSAASLQDAKSSFTNAFIGLIIILTAWLIVDTLMRGIVKGGGNIDGYGPWQTVRCAVQAGVENKDDYFGGDEEYDPAEASGDGLGSAPVGTNACTPIPDSQLVSFPVSATAGDTERGLADTVNRFVAMRVAAAKVGIDLKVSDGYRTPQEQEAAFKGNGCTVVNGKASCQTRTAAIPCSLGGRGSNHTSGTAIDIRLTSGAYNWLQANGGKFGFYNKLGAKDPPHFSSTGF